MNLTEYTALLNRRGEDITKFLTRFCDEREISFENFVTSCNGKPGFQDEIGKPLAPALCAHRFKLKNWSGERLNTVFAQLASFEFTTPPREGKDTMLAAERQTLYTLCYPILSGAVEYQSAASYLHACLECIDMNSDQLRGALQEKDPNFSVTKAATSSWHNGNSPIPLKFLDHIADILTENMRPPKVPIECTFDQAQRATLVELITHDEREHPWKKPRKDIITPAEDLGVTDIAPVKNAGVVIQS